MQGNSQGVKYTFDIVVTKGSSEDRQGITITVNEKTTNPVTESEPKEEPIFVIEPEPEEAPVSGSRN